MKAPNFIRGCGTMPYVGDHPGTEFLFLFLFIGAVAGAKGGWYGALVGFLIMALFMLPIYLLGAAGRAKLSDELVQKRGQE